MPLREDYEGPFDPEMRLASFSRQALADLGREYLLIGHLQDRAGLPLVMMRFGDEAMTQISIEEWMAASPIYSERMQKTLGFVGNDVETVFKNLQLDIGAPPQFMDFQFRLDRPDYGEFWLAHCGALMDVEPFGEQRVRAMCHDIEDPTFDATAAATHPCMKVRPIHRPPRIPEHRMPHCRWMVYIDGEGVEFEHHGNLEINARSRAARLPIASCASSEAGGWSDYAGPFDPGFQLEDLSHGAQVAVLEETAIQIHLLARALSMSVTDRFSAKDAAEIGRDQWTGIAALGAERLQRWLGVGDDLESIAKVFQIHPHFQPRSYLDFGVQWAGDRIHLTLGPCAGREEEDPHSWCAGLDSGVHPALEAIAGVINPAAHVVPAVSTTEGGLAWDVMLDPAQDPWKEPPALALARVSRGATFSLERRRLPRSDG